MVSLMTSIAEKQNIARLGEALPLGKSGERLLERLHSRGNAMAARSHVKDSQH